MLAETDFITTLMQDDKKLT